MKTGMLVTGLAAGVAITTAAITAMYPDIYKRLMRDSRRAIKNGKRFVSRIGV